MLKRFSIALLGILALSACSKSTPPVSVTPEATPPAAQVLDVSGDFVIDPALSTVRWEGKKILVPTRHTGTIAIKEGSLALEKGQLKSGNFTLDMTTINDEDLKDDMKAKLEGHLKSTDFFDVEKFPTATLKINEATLAEGGRYKVKADLTIKGITKPIEYETTVETIGGTLKNEAEFSIDRTQWDIRYGSGKFFEDLGDKVIDDQINFKVNLVGKAK